MSGFGQPLEDFTKDVKDYVELSVDDVKLKATKGLSVTISRVLTTLVLFFVIQLIVLSLTVGLVFVLGKATGNYAVGAFIAAGIFAVILAVLFAFRKKMFTDSFVKLFSQVMFQEDGQE